MKTTNSRKFVACSLLALLWGHNGLAAEPQTLPALTQSAKAQGEKPWLLSGMVRSSAGKAMAGVTVSAKLSGGPVTISVYTDAEGKYYFPPLPQGGEYVVYAQAVGYQLAKKDLTLAGGNNRVDLSLATSGEFLRQLSGWQQLASVPAETRDDRIGKTLLLRRCSACHQTAKVFTRRFDEHGWTAIIDAMEAYAGGAEGGGVLPPERKKQLATYLAKVAGPDPVALKPPVPTVPQGDALYAVIYEYAIPNAEGRYSFSTGDWSEGIPVISGVGAAIHDATLDLNGNAWFSSPASSAHRTLGKLDAKTGEIKSYALPGTPAGAVAKSHGLVIAKDGQIWFTNARGPQLLFAELGTINPDTGEFHSYPTPEGKVPVGGWLNVDGLGNIWTSTGAARGREGVWHFDVKTKQFEQIRSISDGFTYGVAGDREGNGWWAQINLDLIVYANRATGEVAEIQLPFIWGGAPYLKPGDMSKDEYLNIVQGLAGARGNAQMPRRMKADLKDDAVWVANFTGNNLMRIDTKTRKLSYFPVPNDGMNPYDVGVDSSHRVWVGMQNGDEVGRFDPATKTWTIYPLPTKGVSPRSLEVIERDGHVEVGLPVNDASKVIRLIARTQADVELLKKRFYR
jgi:virginiamycin B lyase